MEAVLRKTMGITNDRVRVLVDQNATRSDILSGVQWLSTNAKPGSRIYFAFSGHGSPDERVGMHGVDLLQGPAVERLCARKIEQIDHFHVDSRLGLTLSTPVCWCRHSECVKKGLARPILPPERLCGNSWRIPKTSREPSRTAGRLLGRTAR